MLPLTIGYIGGYGSVDDDKGTSGLLTRAGSFGAGLVTTLSLLGIASSLLGRAYGQFGSGLPIGNSESRVEDRLFGCLNEFLI